MPPNPALDKLAKARPPEWTVRVGECLSALQFAPHGHTLFVGSLNGQLLCLDAAQGKVRWQAAGHPGGTLWLDYHPQSALVASGGQDGTVKIWEANKGTLLQTLNFPKNPWMEHGCWSHDGRFLGVSGGRFIYFFDAEGRAIGQTVAHPNTVLCLDWHPSRQELISGTNGGARVFVPDQAEPKEVIPWGSACLAIQYSPDGKFVAAGNQDQSLQVWPEGAKDLTDHLRMAGYATKVRELSWRSDSSQLSTGGGYNVITWNFRGAGPAGSTPLEQTSHSEFVSALASHPSNPELCASAAKDHFLFLWHDQKLDPVWVRVLPESPAILLSWQKSGEALAAGCSGGEICLYRVKS